MWERNSSSPDPVWEAAWDWVQRQHDTGFEDLKFNEALNRWLQASDSHRLAYEQAAQIWLLAGLVPPKDDLLPTMVCPDPDDRKPI